MLPDSAGASRSPQPSNHPTINHPGGRSLLSLIIALPLLLACQGCVGIWWYRQPPICLEGTVHSPDGSPVSGTEILFLRPMADMHWRSVKDIAADEIRDAVRPAEEPTEDATLWAPPCDAGLVKGAYAGYVTTDAEGAFRMALPKWKALRIAAFGIPMHKGSFLKLKLDGRPPFGLRMTRKGEVRFFLQRPHDVTGAPELAQAPMPDWCHIAVPNVAKDRPTVLNVKVTLVGAH